jgi:hypothetical protein
VLVECVAVSRILLPPVELLQQHKHVRTMSERQMAMAGLQAEAAKLAPFIKRDRDQRGCTDGRG